MSAPSESLSSYEIVWDKTLKQLSGAGLMGQSLSGLHQALLGRDVTLPRIMPDVTRPWIAEDSLKSLEREVRPLLETALDGAVAGERLAPPARSGSTSSMPFTMIRAGALRIDELWLIDDFGQSADLLGPTPARSSSSGQVFNPRVRWDDNAEVIAMPPRVVQPMRLNFRFTAAGKDSVEPASDPALSPVCGWVFYNPLDQALMICDRNGALMGELGIKKDAGKFRINWYAGTDGVALAEIPDLNLRAFAQALVEPAPTASPKLVELLNLIDRAVERIRPAAARRDAVLFGKPLALVSANIGLELFGKAWTDPTKKLVAAPARCTGDLIGLAVVAPKMAMLTNDGFWLAGVGRDDSSTTAPVFSKTSADSPKAWLAIATLDNFFIVLQQTREDGLQVARYSVNGTREGLPVDLPDDVKPSWQSPATRLILWGLDNALTSWWKLEVSAGCNVRHTR